MSLATDVQHFLPTNGTLLPCQTRPLPNGPQTAVSCDFGHGMVVDEGSRLVPNKHDDHDQEAKDDQIVQI